MSSISMIRSLLPGAAAIWLAGLVVLLTGTVPAIPTGPARAAAPSPGQPPCEEFFDQWEVSGAPAGILAMGGFGREMVAAKACVDKGDVATACKHWQSLLAVMDKLGPPINSGRSDVETLIAQFKCAGRP